jgi:hypothetical protein
MYAIRTLTISSRVPMEKISIDTLGPFPPDKDGNIYIIVMVDCFSRYVELSRRGLHCRCSRQTIVTSLQALQSQNTVDNGRYANQ